MGASRYLVGLVCVGLAAGCVESTSSDIASEELNLDYEAANGPDLPVPPAGATCVLIQRGTLGQVQDTDIGYGNGPDFVMGDYPFTWTGPSPYDHRSAYQFNLNPVPANATVVLGVFTNYVSWNEHSSSVRAHVITKAWDEASATWSSFTKDGSETGFDPAVIGTMDPGDVGYRSINITSTVQGWHSGAIENHGLILEEDPVKLHTYFASEASKVEIRPSLYVCYVAGSPDLECSSAGGGCGDNEDCCDGLSCIGGECGTPPPPAVCAEDNAVCSLNTPCCNPSSVCDGVCLPGNILEPIGEGEGPGDACYPIGTSCGADSNCCSGSCLDGLCTALATPATCVELDEMDANGNSVTCDANNPCCDGLSCVGGACQPDEWLDGGSCKVQGEWCDPDSNAWCCWNMWCMADNTCQPPP